MADKNIRVKHTLRIRGNCSGRRATGGFILFEIMLSLVILGVCLTVCIHSISNLIRISGSTYNMTRAAAYEQEILTAISIGGVGLGETKGSYDDKGSPFSWEINAMKDGMKEKYDCRVIWNEAGSKKTVAFRTARAIKSGHE